VQERDKRVPSGGRDGDASGAEKRPRKLPRRVEVPLGHGALFRMLAQFQPELADAGRGARAVGNVREGGAGKPDSVRPPLPAIDCLIDHILRNPLSQLDSPYSQIARPSIVPVAAVSDPAAATAVFYPQRAAAGQALGAQPACPLDYRPIPKVGGLARQYPHNGSESTVRAHDC
jgi:hypothetical protein